MSGNGPKIAIPVVVIRPVVVVPSATRQRILACDGYQKPKSLPPKAEVNIAGKFGQFRTDAFKKTWTEY